MLATILVITQGLAAQEKPYVINFSKDKYGADNKNWSVGEDEAGVMYFGNDIGLLEFDGIRWELNKLPNDLTVRSVSVLSHQTLFTGSYEEFGRWDRGLSGKLQYTSLSSGLDKSKFRNDDFWKIWPGEGFVYFQSFNSIFYYDYQTVEPIPFDRGILFLLKVRNEYWVQAMRGGLYRLKGKTFEEIPGSDLFNNTEVRVILPYRTDQYLIGTATKGLFVYDGKTFTIWNPALSETMRLTDLNCGLLTSHGTYIFGTILDGIYEVTMEGGIVNHISTGNMLQNNTVLSVHEDMAGNIWAGLDRGISYIQYLPKMSYYSDPRGNIGSSYDAILWDDKLFLGTNQGVFYIDKDDLLHSNTLSDMKLVEGSQGQVWSFHIHNERLFCCHNRGLKEINRDMTVSEPFTIGTGVYRMDEYHLKEKDVLLLSTYSFLRIAGEDNTLYNFDILSEPIVNAEVDHLENVWLEHFNKGVYRCRLSDDLKSIENYKYFGGGSNDGLPFKLRLFKVRERIVLLGNGRFYIYDDISDNIVPDERLNTCFKQIDDIRRIIPIRGNLYWALTGNTIYKFSYDGYEANIYESYDIGTRDLSFVHAYENISILNDSANLICLDNGFLLYNDNSSRQLEPKEPNRPFIQAVETTNIRGEITFRFLAKNTFAANYSFQYILEGVDMDWSAPQKINNVSYARLPEGKYIFRVRTVDNLGSHSKISNYAFEILPPWYRSAWAYLGYVLLAAALFWFVWQMVLRRYRNIHLMKIRNRETKRLRRKNEELELVVQDKNARLLTQTFSVIQRNELLLKIRTELEDYYRKQNNRSLAPLFNKVNSLLNNNMDTEEDWKMFLINFEQKHAGMFKNLKKAYPQLTANDLKLCACLKLNMDSKDIASLMNVSVRAVENSRSRLRKKLNIPSQQSLNDFFMKY